MKTLLAGMAGIALLGAGAHGASVSTTITINGTAASGINLSATGTVTFTGGLTASGTFNSTLSLTNPGLTAGVVPITLTITSGSTTGTLSGTVTATPTLLTEILLAPSTVKGNANLAITSGTDGFQGTTGTFTNVTFAGQGSGTSTSGSAAFTINGAGTLTTGGSGGTSPPAITEVWDAASNTSTLAQGTIFIVKGTNLCAKGTNFFSVPRPTTAPDGLKITFTPAAGGTATDALIWYEYNPSGVCQLAGILPSTVAVGVYNVTVTNGTVSGPVAAQVVQSKFELFTQDSTGLGLAVAQNVVSAVPPIEYDLNRLTTGTINGVTISPAHPGQYMVAYGTGLGPVVGSDNVASPAYDFTTHGVTVNAIVGGMTIPVLYAGLAGYAGEDQINFVLPANVPTGCTVSFQISVNGVLSNPTYIAITPDTTSSACVLPGFTTAQLTNFDNGTTYNVGTFSVSQFQESSASLGTFTSNSANGQFARYSVFRLAGIAEYLQFSSAAFNSGSCTVTHTTTSGTTSAISGGPTYLDAGAVTLNGPAASNIANLLFIEDLDPNSASYNSYSLALATSLPGSGTGTIVAGQYTVAGAGGNDVGKFSTSLTLGSPITVTGGLPQVINRSTGLPLSWTGGSATDIVEVFGSSGTTTGSGTSAVTDSWSFVCFATAGAGSFTVPSSVLQQLPPSTSSSTGPGRGFVQVASSVTPVSFTAPLTAGGNIDAGFFFAYLGSSGLATYQ
jgi:uncharacterized protein (TIGR03437 family)